VTARWRRALPFALAAAAIAASWLRAGLAGAGEAVSTACFAGCLLALWLAGRQVRQAGPAGASAWPAPRAAAAGVAVGALLVAPVALLAVPSGRGLPGLLPWASATALVATLEEAVVRGRLQRLWAESAGVVPGLAGSALVFALMHLPAYGLAAQPVDLAVGLALAGLRQVTGRTFSCALAHTLADWGGWAWA
jgi:membrane protease YdiL (CAAX protease family)